LGILGPHYCGIGATIRIGREMLCLPYAGFLQYQTTLAHNMIQGAIHPIARNTLLQGVIHPTPPKIWRFKTGSITPLIDPGSEMGATDKDKYDLDMEKDHFLPQQVLSKNCFT
jgi:hypothetical protein